jgi:hypothetical protein
VGRSVFVVVVLVVVIVVVIVVVVFGKKEHESCRRVPNVLLRRKGRSG